MRIGNPYQSKHYKALLLIPLVLIFISVLFIPKIPQGIDFKGGSLFTVYVENSDNLQEKKADIEKRLSVISEDVSVRTFENPAGSGFEIEMKSDDKLDAIESGLNEIRGLEKTYNLELLQLSYYQGNENETAKVPEQQKKVDDAGKILIEKTNALLAGIGSSKRAASAGEARAVLEEEYQSARSGFSERILNEIGAVVPVKSYSSKQIGASLSRFFLSKTAEVLFYSFVAATIVIFIVFRSFIPSLAVLFGAFADIAITAGGMGLFQIPLSLSTVAALLMLVAFSLDTDMLLTIRAIKRTEGTAKERVFDAMKTGFLMNAGAVTAFTVLLSVSLFLQIQTYYQIASVIIIGVVADFVATWCANAITVLWSLEGKGVE